MTSSNTVQAETYKNARPLDVHTWSEQPEVNAFVNQLFELISSLKGNKNIGKKLVKVVLLDLYLAWSADPNLKIMFSRNNNSYQAKSNWHSHTYSVSKSKKRNSMLVGVNIKTDYYAHQTPMKT